MPTPSHARTALKRAYHTPRHSEAWHNARQHGIPHRSAPPCNTPRQGTPRHDTAQHNTARHGTAMCTPLRHGKTHQGKTQRGTTRQSRAHRNTAQTTTAQHGKAQQNTAQRTKARHSTRARDTNRGSNPGKPPHSPERKETVPQPWGSATPACHARARGHGTPVSKPAPPDGSGPPAQTATRKLQPARQERGDAVNLSPLLTQVLMKPAGATAEPEKREPNPTGQAARPSVYITQLTHGAGARPAANRSTNINPFRHREC